MEHFKRYIQFANEMLESAQIPSNIEKFAKERGVLADVKQIARWANKAGVRITGGTAIGKGYDTLVLDLTYQGAEIYFDTDTGIIKVNRQPVDSWTSFKNALTENNMNEAYSDEERKELADKGFALSDGSFPIKDLKDLKNAIQAYGRAKDQARAAKFIVKRAKALGAEDLIPDTEDFQKSLGESVNEAKNDGNLDTIEDYVKQVLDGGGSFMDIGKMLKGAYKYDFSTGMMPMYVIPVSGNKIIIINKKYVETGQADRLVGDIAIGLMESMITERVSDKEVFSYLNDLRDSGKTNMFGAAAYIEKDFGLDKRKAREILAKWMKSFNEGKLTEGTDIGQWNEAGLKGDEQVLITTFIGPKDIEDLGLGRKCMQINVGKKDVVLNPADIVELKELLKSYKVK